MCKTPVNVESINCDVGDGFNKCGSGGGGRRRRKKTTRRMRKPEKEKCDRQTYMPIN